MKATLLRTPIFAFAALAAAFAFTWNPAPASSGIMNETGSNSRLVELEGYSPEGVFLAKGQRKKVDDFPGAPRNRGRFGHPQPHRLFDDGSDDDFLAKGRGRLDDNPKRHIGPHKLMEDSTAASGALYSQARRRFDDNPTGPRRDDNPRRRFGPHKLIDDTNDVVIAARGKADDFPKRHPRRGHA
jgi:hypothetical protein